MGRPPPHAKRQKEALDNVMFLTAIFRHLPALCREIDGSVWLL
jgi:hypothetical protein